MYDLHLIASVPSDGDRHVNPDDTARVLGTYNTADAAHAEGRRYLREHPAAWLQVQDSEQVAPGEDVRPT